MPSVIELPGLAVAVPVENRLNIAAPSGSAQPMTMSAFFSRRKSDVPASVPPVPTEQMKASILPSVCRQISGPVVR